jgi:hypothetical protein
MVINIGGQGQGRTADTRIFSPLLYQLSYLAVSHLFLQRGEFVSVNKALCDVKLFVVVSNLATMSRFICDVVIDIPDESFIITL